MNEPVDRALTWALVIFGGLAMTLIFISITARFLQMFI